MKNATLDGLEVNIQRTVVGILNAILKMFDNMIFHVYLYAKHNGQHIHLFF
jgi:hypothetical protein